MLENMNPFRSDSGNLFFKYGFNEDLTTAEDLLAILYFLFFYLPIQMQEGMAF